MTSSSFVATNIPEHLKTLSENLYHMQQEGVFCDIIMIGEDGNVKCHSVILSATSSYFKQCISNSKRNMDDPASLSAVYLTEHLVEDIQNLVKLIYTGSLVLSTLNINRIMKLLHSVGMATIVNYLQQHVIPQNKMFRELCHTGSEMETKIMSNLSLTQDSDQRCNDGNEGINDEVGDYDNEGYTTISQRNVTQNPNKSSNSLSIIRRENDGLYSSGSISVENRDIFTPKDSLCEFDNTVHRQVSTPLTSKVNHFHPNESNSEILREDPVSKNEDRLNSINKTKTKSEDLSDKFDNDEAHVVLCNERERSKTLQQNSINSEIKETRNSNNRIYQDAEINATKQQEKQRTSQKRKTTNLKKACERSKVRKNHDVIECDDGEDGGGGSDDGDEDVDDNDGEDSDGDDNNGGNSECDDYSNQSLSKFVNTDMEIIENCEVLERRKIKNRKSLKIKLRGKIVLNLQKERRVMRHRKKEMTQEKICRLCNLKLENKEAYFRHRKEVHMNKNNKIMYWVGSRKFKCDYEGCDYESKFRGYVVRHKDLEHGETIDETKTTVFRCQAEGCTYYHVQKYKLKAHMKDKHSSERMYTCDICDKSFKRQSALNKHKQAHIPVDKRDNAFGCEQCNKRFATNGELKQHVGRSHNPDASYEPKQFLCHKCPYRSIDRSRINLHLYKVHDIPLPSNTQMYRCTVCDYYTFYKRVFESHMSKHAGDNFVCDICGKVFGSQMNLASHRNRHNNENKKLKCSYEGCTYIGPRDGMKRHVYRMHIYKNTKPFVCHLCDYRTNVQWNLTIHLRGKHKMEVETKTTRWQKLMETGQGYNEIFTKDCKTLSENIKFNHLQ